MKKILSLALALTSLFAFALFPAAGAIDDAVGADSVHTDETIVHLGFIGWYNWKDGDGNMYTMQTSFYWQVLKEGDFINWDAVDAAYEKWAAGGGLAPDRDTGWKTSGAGSFRFADRAKIGHVDFTRNQAERYYLSFYIDPGYIAG